MDGKAKLATVLIAGYLLGRTKKMKLALTVAGAIGGRQIFNHRDDLVGRATKLLDSSPGAKKIATQLSTTLLEAATGAAVAAASKGIGSLSDNLLDRAEKLREPKVLEPRDDRDDEDQRDEEAPKARSGGRKRRTDDEPEAQEDEVEEEPEDEAEEPDEEEPEDEAEKPARRTSSRRTSSSRAASGGESRGTSRTSSSTRRSTGRAQSSSSRSTKKSSSA